MSAELYAALVKAQAEMPDLKKGETAKIETRGGGSYSYSYLGLESLINEVRPVLAKHGLTVMQAPQVAGTGHFVLTTNVIHTSGEVVSFEMPLPVPQDADAKQWGSWITYFRRYALLSVLFLAPDADDDGDATTAKKKPAAKKPAAEKDITKGTATQIGAETLVLNEKFPEHPGDNRKWEDAATSWIKDKFSKTWLADLTEAEAVQLLTWLEDTHRDLEANKDVPF